MNAPVFFRSRLLLRTCAGLLLAIGGSVPAGATPRSTVPSVCAFQFDLGHRYFDGVQLTTVLFQSSRLTLVTDTLGNWVPSEQPCESAGFSLHHRTIPGLTLCISLLSASLDSETENYWEDYVQGVQAQLGETATAADIVDSVDNHAMVRFLGGRTREVSFAAPESENYAEYHVLVSKDSAITTFILRGSAQAVAAGRNDFRFFLTRLERAVK